jgi:HEAT repeat protein
LAVVEEGNMMIECTCDKSEADMGQGATADPAKLSALVSALRSSDYGKRVHARQALEKVGHAAVGPLVELLADSSHQARWEAAKTLVAIADADASLALVEALSDEEFDVRWLAAKALIAIGRDGLEPLLCALEEHPESAWLLQGAHNVLYNLKDPALHELVAPTLDALEGFEPEMKVIFAAGDLRAKLAQVVESQEDQA